MTNEVFALLIALLVGVALGSVLASIIGAREVNRWIAKALAHLDDSRAACADVCRLQAEIDALRSQLAQARKNDHRDERGRFVKA